MLCIILTTNSDYLPKEHWPVGFCNGDTVHPVIYEIMFKIFVRGGRAVKNSLMPCSFGEHSVLRLRFLSFKKKSLLHQFCSRRRWWRAKLKRRAVPAVTVLERSLGLAEASRQTCRNKRGKSIRYNKYASFYCASFVRENSRSIIYARRKTRSSSHSVPSILAQFWINCNLLPNSATWNAWKALQRFWTRKTCITKVIRALLQLI
jgi:hypothetical protein